MSNKNFNARTICRSLLDAESESAVQKIIDSIPEMKDSANWHPLDDRETNFNITSNQASDGGKALTELMTNMVDAILMKHASLKHIDPRGAKAPKNMHAAVDLLIKPLQGGKLTYLDSRDPWLRDFAQSNLIIGVTGAKNKTEGLPCYTFVDNGEGQNPKDFRKTFLSLSQGNKKDIAFVQGKYNMGSSGVLGYCGMKWFKLIVSRRYDGKSPWGFTLLRKRPGIGMPVAEYFLLPTGHVPTFDEDTLYPFVRSDRKRYDGVHLKTGTIVKLYDYQIGARFQSFRGSREALNENLVETILPFRILDFRYPPSAKRGGDRAEGVDARGFFGMEFLLLRSHRAEDEDSDDGDDKDKEAVGLEPIAVAHVKDNALGDITITAIPLKRDIPGWLRYSNNRVFHAVNGQVQYKQTRGYLSQSCGFPALKDRVVMIVDASNLTEEGHNGVWKGDREHIRYTITGESYQEIVTNAIKASEALRDLQNKVAREELEQAAKTEGDELFQQLVDRDRTLAELLSDRDPVIIVPSSGPGKGGKGGKGEFEGKYSPTFLRFGPKIRETGLSIPIDMTRPVTALTDVENGYLQRADNKGRLLIDQNVYKRFSVRDHLYNGRLTLFFVPIAKLKVGEEFHFKIGLQDDSMAIPVTDDLTIRIVEPVRIVKPPQPPGPRPPTPHNGTDEGKKPGDGKPVPTYGLPQHRLLTRDGRKLESGQQTLPWPIGFNEYDGGIIEDLGEAGTLYKINYDNSYHLKYRQSARGGDVARDVVTEKYILGMRILMLGYEHALRALKESRGEKFQGFAEYLDEFRKMAARGAASTVLALAENLPKIVDKAAVAAAREEE
jgi:hypothetical protein